LALRDLAHHQRANDATPYCAPVLSTRAERGGMR
jgi:hypothetical protein